MITENLLDQNPLNSADLSIQEQEEMFFDAVVATKPYNSPFQQYIQSYSETVKNICETISINPDVVLSLTQLPESNLGNQQYPRILGLCWYPEILQHCLQNNTITREKHPNVSFSHVLSAFWKACATQLYSSVSSSNFMVTIQLYSPENSQKIDFFARQFARSVKLLQDAGLVVTDVRHPTKDQYIELSLAHSLLWSCGDKEKGDVVLQYLMEEGVCIGEDFFTDAKYCKDKSPNMVQLAHDFVLKNTLNAAVEPYVKSSSSKKSKL